MPYLCELCNLLLLMLYFRVTGFEELGNTDSFPTSVLEKRLGKSGIVYYFEYGIFFFRYVLFPSKLLKR